MQIYHVRSRLGLRTPYQVTLLECCHSFDYMDFTRIANPKLLYRRQQLVALASQPAQRDQLRTTMLVGGWMALAGCPLDAVGTKLRLMKRHTSHDFVYGVSNFYRQPKWPCERQMQLKQQQTWCCLPH